MPFSDPAWARMNVWFSQESNPMRQECNVVKPHGGVTVATYHIRQAEAINAEIERLSEVCGQLVGEILPATPRRKWEGA